jgi:hypothetical protein
MLETIVTLLIYLCLLVLVIYLVTWVLGELGIPVPAQVMKIIWIIVALIAVLYLVRSLPGLGLRL